MVFVSLFVTRGPHIVDNLKEGIQNRYILICNQSPIFRSYGYTHTHKNLKQVTKNCNTSHCRFCLASTAPTCSELAWIWRNPHPQKKKTTDSPAQSSWISQQLGRLQFMASKPWPGEHQLVEWM